MAIADYENYDGLGLAAQIAKKNISAREAVDAAIARAESLNPKLNAIVFEAFDQARDAAKGSDHFPAILETAVMRDAPRRF